MRIGSKTFRTRLAPVFLLLVVLPSTASAHLVMEGAGEIGNGMLHPLVTPAHVMILLGTGLLLGQRVPLMLKTPMLVFSTLSAIALLLTTTGWIRGIYQPLLVGIALGIGVCVALERKFPAVVLASLCAAAALGIGFDSATESPSLALGLKTSAGTWITMNAAVGYTALCASNGADKPWARVGIRIIGSWIIAISFLVLAFSLRK